MTDEEEKKEAEASLESSLETPPEQATEKLEKPSAEIPAAASIKPDNKFRVAKFMHILRRRSTVYLSLFVILIVALMTISYLAYHSAHKTQPAVAEQTLTPQALNKLAKSNTVIGANNQLLTVESSSVFGGPVLAKNSFSVAGNLEGGANLQVAGSSNLNQVQVARNLAVSGGASIQRALVVQSNLSVNGSGTFGGNLSAPQLSVTSLQLNGNLILSHHLVTSGSIPSSNTLGVVGTGGTTSVNGSDTAGAVTINTGGGPGTGCYLSVTFSVPYATTPSVLLTPANSSAAGLSYYVSRSSSGFSVCSANTPASSQSFVFDYMVID